MSGRGVLSGKDHPFLSDPDMWIVAGHSMSGDALDRIPVQGRIQVTHKDGKAVILGEMGFVSRSNPVTFQTSYELTPTGDDLSLDFFQANESAGDLRGKVVVFDDRLVCCYSSGDGNLNGFEVFYRAGDNRYAVTGSLVSDREILSMWKLDLIRPSQEAVGEEKIDQTGKK